MVLPNNISATHVTLNESDAS